MADILVCVPEGKEQECIASYLNRETAKINALVGKIRAGVEQLRRVPVRSHLRRGHRQDRRTRGSQLAGLPPGAPNASSPAYSVTKRKRKRTLKNESRAFDFHGTLWPYRIQQTFAGRIKLERGQREVEPVGAGASHVPLPEQLEPLSQIIRELNERFGTEFTEDDKVFIRELEDRLAVDQALVLSVRANTPENARLTFDHVVSDRLQDMVDTNFKFYKRVTDDQQFAKFFLDWLFERFRNKAE